MFTITRSSSFVAMYFLHTTEGSTTHSRTEKGPGSSEDSGMGQSTPWLFLTSEGFVHIEASAVGSWYSLSTSLSLLTIGILIPLIWPLLFSTVRASSLLHVPLWKQLPIYGHILPALHQVQQRLFCLFYTVALPVAMPECLAESSV